MAKRGIDYERLRLRGEFERLYKEGMRRSGEFVVVFGQRCGDSIPRFGVSASKKVGKAVERNRARRLIREAFLSLLPLTEPGWRFAICARRSIGKASFARVREDLASVLGRLVGGRPGAGG